MEIGHEHRGLVDSSPSSQPHFLLLLFLFQPKISDIRIPCLYPHDFPFFGPYMLLTFSSFLPLTYYILFTFPHSIKMVSWQEAFCRPPNSGGFLPSLLFTTVLLYLDWSDLHCTIYIILNSLSALCRQLPQFNDFQILLFPSISHPPYAQVLRWMGSDIYRLSKKFVE